MKSKNSQTFFVLSTFNSFHKGLNAPYSLARIPLDGGDSTLDKQFNRDIIDIMLTNFYELDPQDPFPSHAFSETSTTEMPEMDLWPIGETHEIGIASEKEKAKKLRLQRIWH